MGPFWVSTFRQSKRERAEEEIYRTLHLSAGKTTELHKAADRKQEKIQVHLSAAYKQNIQLHLSAGTKKQTPHFGNNTNQLYFQQRINKTSDSVFRHRNKKKEAHARTKRQHKSTSRQKRKNSTFRRPNTKKNTRTRRTTQLRLSAAYKQTPKMTPPFGRTNFLFPTLSQPRPGGMREAIK